ncbi:hypothetical protein AB0F81_23125 [Actinoplanes sp. NPDC024001]|uniref:hypothetical protein n=1 Tax=Actinoplanes sp. NPDC024001 TaxID=3154598 RepID=UPI0033DC143B
MDSLDRRRRKRRNRPAPPALTGAEKHSLLASYLQGAAAVIALGISTAAFVQQIDLNRKQVDLYHDQVVLNDYARARDERRYSSRVAFWVVAGKRTDSTMPPGLDVYIQNRSPTPLRNVEAIAELASGGRGVVTLVDIPPCTIEAHRIAPPSGDTLAKTQRRIAGYDKLRLEFTVDTRRWELTSEKLTEVAARPATAPAPRLRHVRFDPDPTTTGNQAEDCGEGG